MKLKQSLLVLSLVVLGVLFAACGGGGTPGTMVTLTVEKAGTGNGTVTSTPPGISLEANDTAETAEFATGTTVTLTAVADEGSTVSFSGCTAGTGAEANTCVVTVNENTTVTATFTSDTGGDVVNGVTIDQENFDLGVGQEVTLTATVDRTGNAATTVTWESSNPEVAAVNENGVVIGVAVGTATITARSTADNSKFDTVEVNVTAEQQVSVDIQETDFFLQPTETRQLNATVTGSDDTSVTWMSSDESVATVDANGMVTAIANGTATITATSTADETKFDSVTVTVGTVTSETIQSSVAQGSDDAEEYRTNFTNGNASFTAGQVEIDSSDLELTREDAGTGTQQLVGVRFADLNIPQGATITNAYIQFTAKGDSSGDTTITVAAQNDVSAPTFVETANNISSRTPTTETVTWQPEAWLAGGTYQTADLSTVVQELVSADTWNSTANAIAFIITGTDTNLRRAQSFSGSTAAARPTLFVTYTVP